MISPLPQPVPLHVRKRQAALAFLLAVSAVLLAEVLQRLLLRILPPGLTPLAQEALHAALLLGALLLCGSRLLPEVRALSSVGLVRRPTMAAEFARGTAIGWAISLLLLLPGLLTGRMHTVLTWDRQRVTAWFAGVLLLLLNALATQLIFTGLPFRSLVRATSPAVATLTLSVVAAVLAMLSRGEDLPGALFEA